MIIGLKSLYCIYAKYYNQNIIFKIHVIILVMILVSSVFLGYRTQKTSVKTLRLLENWIGINFLKPCL